MSRVQVVRPAGAGHETLYVALVALLILVLAATVVSLRGEREDEPSIAAHQLDARRDLNAAEQGIYTDLRVAFDEIQARRAEAPGLISVELLAEEGFAPFLADASSVTRGGHQWRQVDAVYLGLSPHPEVAGSFLLLVPEAHDGVAEVWLNRDASAALPTERSADALQAAGWKQIAAHYDAGVTRQHQH
ncbi:DUF6162 family protein [Pseudomonas japonica]|uniref:Periplasmic protein n=1 Tax=Pseudomonas japonica TaxID=256466 RepID=A0A239HSI4_9PSED|nr:DUF6162 family protein [Pseudomonas japonica]SNS84171.1 hypothetical protein SAMN05444352_11681 [Pseudomonas japonica]